MLFVSGNRKSGQNSNNRKRVKRHCSEAHFYAADFFRKVIEKILVPGCCQFLIASKWMCPGLLILFMCHSPSLSSALYVCDLKKCVSHKLNIFPLSLACLGTLKSETRRRSFHYRLCLKWNFNWHTTATRLPLLPSTDRSNIRNQRLTFITFSKRDKRDFEFYCLPSSFSLVSLALIMDLFWPTFLDARVRLSGPIFYMVAALSLCPPLPLVYLHK